MPMNDWKASLVPNPEQIQNAKVILEAMQIQFSTIEQWSEVLNTNIALSQGTIQSLLWVLNGGHIEGDIPSLQDKVIQQVARLFKQLWLSKIEAQKLHIGEWNNGQATIHRLLWELAKNLDMKVAEVPEWDWPVDSADMGIVGK